MAGIAVQVPAIMQPGAPHPLAAPAATAAFYCRHVLVAALAGWRLAPRFTAAAGPGGAVAIAAAVAVDACLRRSRAGWSRLVPAVAVVALAAVLGTGWVTSYRYRNMRSTARLWAQTVARFDRLCRHRPPAARVELYPSAHPQARSPVPCADADPGPPASGRADRQRARSAGAEARTAAERPGTPVSRVPA